MTVEPSVNNHPQGKGRLQEEVAYHNQTTNNQTDSSTRRSELIFFLRGEKRMIFPAPPSSMVKAPRDEVEQYHVLPPSIYM